jgi:hypothetical protein
MLTSADIKITFQDHVSRSGSQSAGASVREGRWLTAICGDVNSMHFAVSRFESGCDSTGVAALNTLIPGALRINRNVGRHRNVKHQPT